MQVSYHDILVEWELFHDAHTKKLWDELWLMCEKRMAALIKSKCKGFHIPADTIHDMIRDASTEVMGKLRDADMIDCSWVSSRFWFAYRHVITTYIRDSTKAARLTVLDDKISDKRCDFFS